MGSEYAAEYGCFYGRVIFKVPVNRFFREFQLSFLTGYFPKNLTFLSDVGDPWYNMEKIAFMPHKVVITQNCIKKLLNKVFDTTLPDIFSN